MTPLSSALSTVIQGFDGQASSYDEKASLQHHVAERLVALARAPMEKGQTIFDIGCGTGFVAEAAAQTWPEATIYAIDPSLRMLEQVQKKSPHLKRIQANASALPCDLKANLILSSMMMHWLEHPRQVLQYWQDCLKPQGKIYVALLGQGSFRQWQDLCEQQGVRQGTWPMPAATFADGLAFYKEQETVTISYDSVADFLKCLKHIGAATPRADYRTLSVPQMRRLLVKAPKPFAVSYQVLYLGVEPRGSGTRTI